MECFTSFSNRHRLNKRPLQKTSLRLPRISAPLILCIFSREFHFWFWRFFLQISISIFLSRPLSFPFLSILYRFVTHLFVLLSMELWLVNFTGKGEI